MQNDVDTMKMGEEKVEKVVEKVVQNDTSTNNTKDVSKYGLVSKVGGVVCYIFNISGGTANFTMGGQYSCVDSWKSSDIARYDVILHGMDLILHGMM